jgi:hypothetical protein
MGVDASQLTQNEEQSLFTLKSDMPIPMLVFEESFQWAKYGHHILPSSLDLTSNNKAGLHLQKSPNWNLSSKLFQDDSNDEKKQFVGFVSSQKKGTLLTSFHTHSFVVSHTDLQKNTIVTCILTSQNHILSNMQD